MVTKKSFNKSWEQNIYPKSRQMNEYPYDLLISIVARKFFKIPLAKRKNVKVLDLGCGAGNNSKFFAEKGFDLYGIDGSKTAIEICKQKFEQWKLSGTFTVGDFLNLPYKNNFFDLVIDRESLYANKFNDIKRAVDQIYSKLKSGGLVVSFIYNVSHQDKDLGREIEKNTYMDFKSGTFQDTGVVHFVDMKEVLELYRKFHIENILDHSIREVYNKSERILEFDEYVIIASKK